jgi:hypothetical protein
MLLMGTQATIENALLYLNSTCTLLSYIETSVKMDYIW